MAVILDGKKLSKKIKEELKVQLLELKKYNVVPGLAVVLVGEDPASKVYVNRKKKTCEQIGINSFEYILNNTATEEELIKLIHDLNNDERVDGILVQLPLPKHINEKNILSEIAPEKDVDVFHPENMGKILNGTSMIAPCTPAGIMELIREYNIDIQGKECVVVGRSNIVGKPVSILLLAKNATVTICHSKTKNLFEVIKRADIIVSAVGKPNIIKAENVKENAVVIDVGINRMPDGSLCGDVDFDEVEKKASFITPVPGGVGPMTIAMLMKNVVKLSLRHKGY